MSVEKLMFINYEDYCLILRVVFLYFWLVLLLIDFDVFVKEMDEKVKEEGINDVEYCNRRFVSVDFFIFVCKVMLDCFWILMIFVILCWLGILE